jgi:hypothetical protein
MSSIELDGDVWTIPGERYKSKLDHVIPLSAAAKALVSEKPEGVRGNSWFVFSTTFGEKPFSGFSKAKNALDKEIAKLRKAVGLELTAGKTREELILATAPHIDPESSAFKESIKKVEKIELAEAAEAVLAQAGPRQDQDFDDFNWHDDPSVVLKSQPATERLHRHSPRAVMGGRE